ncbi:hypothetical protein CL622_06615 [archaeon]|nr:hypothetical protein [archaeon]|tara:strand:- start:652 stop:1260 length:609 start_codon:yes stop_codon:yes gene_type:complete
MDKQLTKLQKDTLKEVSSIAANAASTALSKLTDRRIKVKLSKLTLMHPDDMPVEYKKEEDVGILFGIKGAISGSIVSLSSKESVYLLVDMIKGELLGTTTKLTEQDKDLIKEVGNILVGSYLTALSTMTRLKLPESTPILMESTAQEILKEASSKIKGRTKQILVIENDLIVDERKFKQELILILLPKTLELLFSRLFKWME